MKLLVIPGFSEKFDSANWICLRELLQALKAYPNVSVEIVGDILDKGMKAVSLKTPILYAKKIWYWPAFNPQVVDVCYRSIVEKLNTTNYDGMLVMHMPYDGVVSAVRAKKEFPNLKLWLYELDPITYEIDRQRRSMGRYLYFMRVLAEKKTFKACDKIFHMECNRKKYADRKYDSWRGKFEYLDFPLVHNNEKEEQGIASYEGQTVQLIYTGKLMTHFRSPTYLLDVLKEVQGTIDIHVRFYSGGDCEKQIALFSEEHSWVEQCGYVDKEKIDLAIGSSDCLINIGNKMSDMLPSKLLTYIETGMPILHVKNQEDDACVSYLEKYELALIINEKDPAEVSAKKMILFIQNSFGKRLSGDWIAKTYCKNTPEYSAKCIYDALCQTKGEKV